MADKTKIDWADASWNPVTGCLHGCEYCYARRMAHRYAGGHGYSMKETVCNGYNLYELRSPGKMPDGRKAVYPFDFSPTLHRYRLDIPGRWQRPRTIFVCSMADLFGNWVPDDWITTIFEACKAATQHRYLFLTKNPKRYLELADKGMLPMQDNFWYGSSVPDSHTDYYFSDQHNTFVSIEPILGDFAPDAKQRFNWAIIGAETGNRKDKVVPDRSWIEHVVTLCRNQGIPVFMKSSIKDLMGEDFCQEFPWEVRADG